MAATKSNDTREKKPDQSLARFLLKNLNGKGE